MDRIRVLLVDDQTLFAESLKGVLDARYPELHVVGIAHDGRNAIECVRELVPDVILMDVRMPVMDGVEATGAIHTEYPAIRIIMLTTFDDDEYVQEAISRGAMGYVLKNIPIQDLVDSIRVVREGAFLMTESVASRLVHRFVEPARAEDNGGKALPAWFKSLTRREKEILFLIAKGCDNKEIADRLCLAEQTTRNHVSVIYSKLGVHDRANAIKAIIESNLDFSG
ncbi:response regulator transcription factor [Salinispira pacifica]